MKSVLSSPTRTVTYGLLFSMLVTPGLVFAQDQPDNSPVPPEVQRQNAPNTGGWRRVDEPPPSQPSSSASPSPNYYPNYSQNPSQHEAPYSNRGPAPSYGPVPSQLTIKPGTFVTVRINEPLSSDRNQAGDAFSASLVKPLVLLVAIPFAATGAIIALVATNTSLSLWPRHCGAAFASSACRSAR